MLMYFKNEFTKSKTFKSQESSNEVTAEIIKHLSLSMSNKMLHIMLKSSSFIISWRYNRLMYTFVKFYFILLLLLFSSMYNKLR